MISNDIMMDWFINYGSPEDHMEFELPIYWANNMGNSFRALMGETLSPVFELNIYSTQPETIAYIHLEYDEHERTRSHSGYESPQSKFNWVIHEGK